MVGPFARPRAAGTLVDEMTFVPSGEQIEIVHGDRRVTVVEVGGALRAFHVSDRAVLDGYAREEMCTGGRGQTLLPWPNRLQDGTYEFDAQQHQLPLTEPETGTAIHGLVRWVNWTVAERGEHRVLMAHSLRPQPGYPFALQVFNEYSLDDDGLTVTTTAHNVGDRACPYGTGAHPYVTVGTDRIDAATLHVPAAASLIADDRQIPVGSRALPGTAEDFSRPRTIGRAVLDTAFTGLQRDGEGRARVALSAPDGGPRATVWMDRAHDYVMVFSGDPLSEPTRRRGGLAVEPMTCAPNAFRSGEGLRRLEAGASFTSRWGIEYEPRA